MGCVANKEFIQVSSPEVNTKRSRPKILLRYKSQEHIYRIILEPMIQDLENE